MTDDEKNELGVLTRVLAENTKAVNELTIVILGKDGQGGCYRSHTQLKKDFYNFRLICIVFLSSAGVFGGGGFLISKLFGG